MTARRLPDHPGPPAAGRVDDAIPLDPDGLAINAWLEIGPADYLVLYTCLTVPTEETEQYVLAMIDSVTVADLPD